MLRWDMIPFFFMLGYLQRSCKRYHFTGAFYINMSIWPRNVGTTEKYERTFPGNSLLFGRAFHHEQRTVSLHHHLDHHKARLLERQLMGLLLSVSIDYKYILTSYLYHLLRFTYMY